MHSGTLRSGMAHISSGTDRSVVRRVGLGLGKICQKTSAATIMKINFGFALLVYYTWWLIVLVCLVIILYKLLTNQNFTIGFGVGIQSLSRQDRDSYVFEPVLVCHRNSQPASPSPQNNLPNQQDSDLDQVDNQ